MATDDAGHCRSEADKHAALAAAAELTNVRELHERAARTWAGFAHRAQQIEARKRAARPAAAEPDGHPAAP